VGSPPPPLEHGDIQWRSRHILGTIDVDPEKKISGYPGLPRGGGVQPAGGGP